MFDIGTRITTLVYTAQASSGDESFWSTIIDLLISLIQVVEEVFFELFNVISRFIAGADPLTIILLLTCAMATIKIMLRSRRLRYQAVQRQQQPQI